MRRLFACLMALAPFLIVNGQSSIKMSEVQVTAHRRLRDTGLQQTVLDTAVLHQNVAYAMSDILTHHSSLFIKSYGRATESTAEFRGTSPTHTQVLWNGMKINSPMLGTVDFSTIPAYFVDEARLLHGASSLSITGGGLGGAVELSTLAHFAEGHALQYVQGVGQFDTYDQFLRYTYGGERWSSSTRVAYFTSDNDFRYTNYDKIGAPRERNKSGYFDDVHLLQEVFYRSPKAGRFSLQAWYSYSLRGLPFLSVDYKSNTDFKNEHLQNTLRSVLSWDKTLSRITLNAKTGYTYMDIDYDYFTTRLGTKNVITASQTHSQQAFVDVQADWMPRSTWLLTARMGTRFNHVRSQDRSPFHIGDNYNRGRMETDLHLSAKWRPLSRLNLSAVLREECYGRDLVPIIPALFMEVPLISPHSGGKATLVLKGSVARNYRYPSMDDLYYKPGGNPDLKPEHGFTYDGGLEGSVEHRRLSLKFNLSAFDSYITDWILWTPNAKGFWQPSNLKKVHSYGTELSASAQLRLKHHWQLAFSGNYGFTPSINRSQPTSANDASYGRQLVYVPRHSANFSARLSWRSWSLAYQWMHYSERFTTTSNEVSLITGRLKPYYMSNLSLEKSFRWKWFHASVKGVVNNLLGSEYVTVLSRPMPGRHFEIFLELKPQWKKK